MSISTVDPIFTRDETGTMRKRQPIVPNRWKGETGCLVGPFSDSSVARYFAGYVVDFGHYSAYTYDVIAVYDSWYVEVSSTQDTPEAINA